MPQKKNLPVIPVFTGREDGLAPAAGAVTGTRVLHDDGVWRDAGANGGLPADVAFTDQPNIFTVHQALTRTDSGNAPLPADLQVSVTYTQSGTASSINLGINRIETTLGSGTRAFERYQVNSVDKWVLNNQGQVTVGSWQGSPVGVPYGGTGSNFSATGGTGQFLKQTSTGGALTVGPITDSDLAGVHVNILAANGNLDMGGFRIVNLASPVSPNDAVNKLYADALIQGVPMKPAALVVATSPLPANTYSNGVSGVGATLTATANGSLTVDSVLLTVGNRVLVIGEATAANDGLYDVTQAGDGSHPYILTRNVNMDTAGEFGGAQIPVTGGTIGAGAIFLCLTVTPTVGTTPIQFMQLNQPYSLVSGLGISIVGNMISVASPVALTDVDNHFTYGQTLDLPNASPSGYYLIGKYNGNTLFSLQRDGTAAFGGAVNGTDKVQVYPDTGEVGISVRLASSSTADLLSLNDVIGNPLWQVGYQGEQTITQTDTSTSGLFTSLAVTVNYSQGGTAGSTNLLINRVETSLGSDPQRFIDLQQSGSSLWYVNSDGSMVVSSTAPSMFGTTSGDGNAVLSVWGGTGKGLVVRAGSGTSNAVEFQDNGGTSLAYLGNDGAWHAPLMIATTLTVDQIVGTIPTPVSLQCNQLFGAPGHLVFGSAQTVVLIADGSSVVNGVGDSVTVQISPTYSQNFVAGSCDLLINRHEVSLGSGGHFFARFQANGVDQFTVTNAGVVSAGVWQGTLVDVGHGGTGANFTATGGPRQFVKQLTTGGPLTVGTLTGADLPGGLSGLDNPTATVGLTAVNGSATTAMRSDAAPALSVAISPTWSGTHTFARTLNQSSGVAMGLTVSPSISQSGTAGYTALLVNAAESSSGSGNKYLLDVQLNASSMFRVDRGGNVVLSGTLTAGSTPTVLTDGAGKILSAALNTVNLGQGGTGATTQAAALNNLLPSQGGHSGQFLKTDGANASWAVGAGGGSGTVTSVDLSVPAWLHVSGNPITTSGTLAVTADTTQAANSVLATPDGSTGALSVRVLVANDIPGLDTAKLISGTLPEVRGGTNQSTYTLGDLLYASAANTLSKLAGNTTSTRKFLRQTGTGTVSAAPAWDMVTQTDVGLSNVENTALSTWAGSTNLVTLGTVTIGIWHGTKIDLAHGGTNADLSATGGTGFYLKQTSVGANITVGAIPAADLPGAFSGFANPSATVGLTAVNGSATTAMRSDGAPALNVTIAPTWTGVHTFAPTTNTATSGTIKSHFLNPTYNQASGTASNIDLQIDRVETALGSGSQYFLLLRAGSAGTTNKFAIDNTGAVVIGSWGGSKITEGFGGTNQSTYTLGDLLYASAANTLSKLTGNTTSTRKFLRQTGTGSVSAAPAWDTLASGDLGSGTANSTVFLRGDLAWSNTLTGAMADATAALTVTTNAVTPTATGGNTYTFSNGADTTVNIPTGTPIADGQIMTLRFKNTDGSNPHTLTMASGTNGFRFGSDIVSGDLTAAASKTLYVGCRWNNTDSKWDVVSKNTGF